jgi:glucokinase
MKRDIKIPTSNFDKNSYSFFIIGADVGGTNTSIAIIGIRNHVSFEIIFKHAYLTKEITVFEHLLNETLSKAKEEYDIEVGTCVIGAAGPVSDERDYVKLTNADLSLNKFDILNKTLLNKVILLNDFEAIGYGLDLLNLNEDAIKLPHIGEDLTEDSATSSFATIGAGTGFGMCIAPYDPKRKLHVPFPSEGGHMELSPNNRLEMELIKYLKEKVLQRKQLHPDIESVLSGPGLENIYNFLVSGKLFKNRTIRMINQLTGGEKLAEIEAHYELDKTCKETVDMFISFYARAAKNLALMSKCYSGLFIAGKIALKEIEFIKDKAFMEEFEKHDKRPDILKKIPVYVITNTDVSLYGCANASVNFFS